MDSPSSQFISSRRMGVYDPIHQISMWEENFKSNDNNLSVSTSIIEEGDMKLANQIQSEDASHGIFGTSVNYDQGANKLTDKTQRRLAQNREAARKSRLKKKAYVQQLEACRLKLMQLELEVDHAKQQGLYVGDGLGSNNFGFAGSVNPGITIFKMEHEHWVEEQNRQILELRTALSSHMDDIQFGTLVQGIMNHYSKLFSLKSAAAKSDVFYVMSGMWKTTAERFFLWIGGFRPSELLKVLVPLIEPLTEQQRFDAYGLEKSCQQAEDALSQGMEKLQQMLADSVGPGQLVEGTYIPQMDTAMERLEALVSFVNQADHLRQETLRQMSRILTVRQSGRFLLALMEYFQRLRALSKLWVNRPRELA
ncbi:transcription factor TGA1 isoform X2 [Cajanus cajan]|uniref:transcription factor TGA1 isoform X2 n=1 Tax=Cajanus cajan TaxID=3821 RepID=UPI0010FB34D5|nr:transcription factor TGA1 isoform X2 [Cajanus cajan]